jgi:hypothetical protein
MPGGATVGVAPRATSRQLVPPRAELVIPAALNSRRDDGEVSGMTMIRSKALDCPAHRSARGRATG